MSDILSSQKDKKEQWKPNAHILIWSQILGI